MSRESTVDLAVVGAGIYGIQAARIYLEIHPEHNVVVFEASESVGGVWSRGRSSIPLFIVQSLILADRVYDGFWTQTPLGIAEFSDMPLKGIPAKDQYYGFFPAAYMAKYLEDYVATRMYSGVSLHTRFRLKSKVLRLTKIDNGWFLDVRHTDRDIVHEERYRAPKVIDATGLTSTPNMPLLAGRELFQGVVAHHLEFGKLQNQIMTQDQYENVMVIGGAKSAADMAYVSAKAGKAVSWIIRKEGAGPAAFVSAKGSAMYNNSNESFYTRLTSHFLASLYMDESKSMLGRFLYRTKIGSWVLRYVWSKIDAKAHKLADYDRQDGKVNQYYNLQPDTPLFWQNDSTGICQRDDFFDVIAKNVKVHRGNIAGLTKTGVVLADETFVPGDVILCGTGWKTSHPDIVTSDGKDLAGYLGLSDHPSGSLEELDDAQKASVSTAADEILHRFPILANPPIKSKKSNNVAPLRLYKGIVPVHDQSIAFVGQLLLGNNFRVAEVQALFAVAALDRRLRLPSADIMQQEIVKHNTWSRLRYLEKGRKGNWLYWDMVPYTDHLLDCLELRSHRPHGWFGDLFSTCFASDLKNVIKEYKAKYEGEKSSQLT